MAWALRLMSSAKVNHSAFCFRHCSMIGSMSGDRNPISFDDFPVLKNIRGEIDAHRLKASDAGLYVGSPSWCCCKNEDFCIAPPPLKKKSFSRGAGRLARFRADQAGFSRMLCDLRRLSAAGSTRHWTRAQIRDEQCGLHFRTSVNDGQTYLGF